MPATTTDMVTISLTADQLLLIQDLLSHDADVLADLVGYGDENGNTGGEWFNSLIADTYKAALNSKRV